MREIRDPVAQLERVEYAYDSFPALDGISVSFNSGITGLLGLNGAGKSTLLRLLATVTRADAGQVRLFGISPTPRNLRNIRGRIGYLPQSATWSQSVRVSEFLRLFSWMRGIPSKQVPSRVEAALARTQLISLADKRLGALSGGQHRRAMIAQALLHDPELLLLDEPTVGLDPRQRVEIRQVLQDISGSTSTIISTHLLDDISTIANDVAVIHRGRISYHGSLAGLEAGGRRGGAASALEAGFLDLIGLDREE
jgi:ABC-2 type transport system ATP-binding protein